MSSRRSFINGGDQIAIAAVAVFLMMIAPPPALADQAFDNGVSLYKKGNYREAIASFQQALRKNPSDTNSIYYTALCHQLMGDRNNALASYAKLIANYSYTDAGKYAIRALGSIDPRYLKQLMAKFQPGSESNSESSASRSNIMSSIGASAPASSDLDRLPSEARVYYQKQGNVLFVDATANNRGIRMVFDTGAEQTVFGKNHLRQLGIKPPEGEHTGYSAGVGSNSTQRTWSMNVDLKVGTIERKNFPISVQDDLPADPLLGQTFFRDFVYTIDSGANSIHFQKKQKTASAGSRGGYGGEDRYAVPFTKEGNELLVQVEVNGRKTPMYFDTGASGITFSRRQAELMNLRIPEDATPSRHQGVGGETMGLDFEVNRMKMGPIDKSNIPISVIEQSNMRYPLLGQTFFGDWQYTIDNNQHVIRFVRR